MFMTNYLPPLFYQAVASLAFLGPYSWPTNIKPWSMAQRRCHKLFYGATQQRRPEIIWMRCCPTAFLFFNCDHVPLFMKYVHRYNFVKVQKKSRHAHCQNISTYIGFSSWFASSADTGIWSGLIFPRKSSFILICWTITNEDTYVELSVISMMSIGLILNKIHLF